MQTKVNLTLDKEPEICDNSSMIKNTIEQFVEDVDKIVMLRLGLSVHDLADFPFFDYLTKAMTEMALLMKTQLRLVRMIFLTKSKMNTEKWDYYNGKSSKRTRSNRPKASPFFA